MGADMIEFDVRQTQDGVLVAHHDPSIRSKRISNMSYEQIKQIDGDIPTYEEVLRLTQDKIKLDIELKEAGYEKEAVNIALQYFSIDDFIMTSFVGDCVSSVKRYHPKVRTGLILGRHQIGKALLAKLSAKCTIKWANKTGADCLVLDYKLAGDRPLKVARENGFAAMVWTVNEKKDLRRFLASDLVCGVITNYPDLAVELKH